MKMWILRSVRGIHPFVGATLAMVENNPVIRLLHAMSARCVSEDVTSLGGDGEKWDCTEL